MINNRLYYEDVRAVAESKLPWEMLQGRSVLITGATGLIGSFLVDVLMFRNKVHAAEIGVYGLGRSAEKAFRRFKAYQVKELAPGGAGWAKGDCDSTETVYFLQHDIAAPMPSLDIRFDAIIHAASNTHPKAYAGDPVGTITANVFGLYNLLDYARLSRATRFYMMSSVEIYGENRNGSNAYDEQSMGYLDCNTLRAGYPESKRLSESLLQAFIWEHGRDAVIGRFCRIFGPTMLEDDSKAVAQFIRNAVNGEDIVLKSDGTQCFSYCYVADAVSGLLLTLLKGRCGEAYNICGVDSAITLGDLAFHLAAKSRPDGKVIFQLPEETEKRGFSTATRAVMDGTKLSSLGFEPLYTVRDGIERTVDILREEIIRGNMKGSA